MLGANIILMEAMRIVEQRRKEKELRKGKIRIKYANTPKACVVWPAAPVHHAVHFGAIDYTDELRQQAKWDAEKCANQ